MPVSIDGLGRSTRVPSGQLLELHEDQVPELEEPVAVLIRAAGRAALKRLALVDEDLRARAAWTGVAHLPEIGAGADPDDLVVGEAGDLLPEVEGVVVICIDGDQQAILGEDRGPW